LAFITQEPLALPGYSLLIRVILNTFTAEEFHSKDCCPAAGLLARAQDLHSQAWTVSDYLPLSSILDSTYLTMGFSSPDTASGQISQKTLVSNSFTTVVNILTAVLFIAF
jgi:hypothetical protein